jgi:hypothetical protein
LKVAGTLTENFNGEENNLPYYPLVGGYLPDDQNAFQELMWDAYYEFFRRVGGIKDGVGIDGTPALVLGSHAEPVPLAFIIPLEMEKSAEYLIEFKMNNLAGNAVEVGMGYMEYDSLIPFDDFFTINVYEKHFVGGNKAVTVSGPSPWTSHKFTLKTGPKTKMVHLNFYRFGDVDPGETIIDDISIRKLNDRNIAED